MRNVFVLGLDSFNGAELASTPAAERCDFVDLLGYDALVHPKGGEFDFDALWRDANAQLDAFPGTVDGIVSYWDFPSSALGPLLRNQRGLPGPSDEAVAKCEHKYFSRLEQRAVVPDLVPDFCVVDPFADDPMGDVDLAFPFWIKPVKAHSSHLGFRIHDPGELARHLADIRAGIGLFGRPFDQYLNHVALPDEIRRVTGYCCIAEAIISAGRQCTLEGYVSGGEVTVYGVVDSIRSGKHRSCFARYQYPSSLPARVQTRMMEAAARVMSRIGYDNAPFNMEFFWNRRTDECWLLEVNARISKSHCPLFRLVDGVSNQQVMVDLALGRRPAFPHRQGDFKVAGKFMVRVYEDGIIRRMPSEGEMDRIRERFPEARVHLLASEGTALEHLPYQDSYSFELAEIFLGAGSQRELLEKYDTCLDILTFDLAEAA